VANHEADFGRNYALLKNPHATKPWAFEKFRQPVHDLLRLENYLWFLPRKELVFKEHESLSVQPTSQAVKPIAIV
jgi:hypothetical protein